MHFRKIDSTNAYLKRNYQKLDNMTFVSASYQSKGKGRNDRVWVSNKGDNLMFSLLIKDHRLIDKFASLSLLSGAVILKTLNSLGISNVSIKWPNDVYINDKKVCGILMESVSISNKIEALVIGIGLNVNQKEFPTEANAVSIRQIKGRKYFIHNIKRNVYNRLKNELSLLLIDKSDYLKLVKDNNYLLNKNCYATINNKSELITVIDINDDNSLLIKKEDTLMNISSGEITFHK